MLSYWAQGHWKKPVANQLSVLSCPMRLKKMGMKAQDTAELLLASGADAAAQDRKDAGDKRSHDFLMAALLGVALVFNLMIRPVAEKHWEKEG